MSRRCAVFGCDNTTNDNKTNQQLKSFAFPEDRCLAAKWKESLELNEFPLELLQMKFVVCSEHFHQEDVELNDVGLFLKSGAIPILSVDERQTGSISIQEKNTNDENSDSVGIISANHSQIQRPPLIELIPNGMQNSYHSTASTNNTDICILENDIYCSDNDSNGIGKIDKTDPHKESQCQSSTNNYKDSAFGFTLLHAPPPVYTAIDESTEVLMLHSAYSDKRALSSTDSDVEVLTSDEVIDSDLATAASETVMEKSQNQTINDIDKDLSEIEAENSATIKSAENPIDMSIEGLASNSVSHCEELSKSQLLNIVREQSTRIRQLEAILNRYRRTQQSLFDHVDQMRKEFEMSTREFNGR